MQGKSRAKPAITMKFWKQDGRLFYADTADLLDAIQKSGRSDLDIRSRLGAGHSYLDRLLKGDRLDGWAIAHIEWGLDPNDPPMNLGASTPSGFDASESKGRQ